MARRGFPTSTDVPGWLRDPAFLTAVSPTALHTLMTLWSRADAHGTLALSQAALAEALGVRADGASRRVAEALAVRWHGQPVLTRTSDVRRGGRFGGFRYQLVFGMSVLDAPVSDESVSDASVSDGSVSDKPDTVEMASGRGKTGRGSVSAPPEVSSPQTPLLPNPSPLEQAVLDLNESSLTTSASGNSGSDPDPNSLRRSNLTRARTRDDPTSFRGETAGSSRPRARAKPAPDPAVKRLLLRHQALYQAKTGAAFPVVWGRDGKLVKQLCATYGESTLERLQDAFFAQPLDSVAGRKGFTVPGFFTEAPALAARAAQGDALTPEQVQRRASLEFLGCEAATALALVTEVPLEQIDRQLAAWPHRTGIRRPAAALPRAIREDWPLPELPEADPGWAPLQSLGDGGEEDRRPLVSDRDPVLRALGDVTRDLWPASAH